MHISILDDNEFIIYLNKDKISNINFEVYDEIENYFRKLFLTLKKSYSININGYYYIKIYKDKLYGIIIEIKGEDIDYMDLFDNQVEMNIEIKDDDFLYEIDDDFFLKDRKNTVLYNYHQKFYLYLKNKISLKDYLTLMEFSKLIYGDKAKLILNNGIKI